jgi:hypothetical protein
MRKHFIIPEETKESSGISGEMGWTTKNAGNTPLGRTALP